LTFANAAWAWPTPDRLLQLNGGTLTLASEPEKGTAAKITLPYE
jgi:hypothetical protein